MKDEKIQYLLEKIVNTKSLKGTIAKRSKPFFI